MTGGAIPITQSGPVKRPGHNIINREYMFPVALVTTLVSYLIVLFINYSSFYRDLYTEC